MKNVASGLMLFGLLILCGCKQNSNALLEQFNQEVYTPDYASGFKIIGSDEGESTIICVYNPWQNAKDVEMHYFIARNNEQRPVGFTGQVIQGNAKRIVCLASSYIAMLDELGQVDRVVGVSGIDFITNTYIQSNRDSVKELGADVNYEILLSLSPDVVLLYGVGDAQSTVTDKLQELGIPHMYIGEYLEESPLGKAEWLVAVSELTDSREKGVDLFQAIPRRYNELKVAAEAVTHRPTVMLNTPWNDSWVMPSTNNYITRLIQDAGGEYIYKKNTSNRSEPIGLETAYSLISIADFWLNVGSVVNLDQLKAMNPKFTHAKAIQHKAVYNNNKRLTPGGGNDFWESAVVRPDVVLKDLILIFHPELLSGELYYYRYLE